MKLYNLTHNAACKKHKAFTYKTVTQVSDFARKSRMTTNACVRLVCGESESEVLKDFHESFQTLDYPTQLTRDFEEAQSVKEIRRYVAGEMQIAERRVVQGPKEIDIGVGETVTVEPDFIRIGDAYDDAVDGTHFDGSITVVKIHTGKAPSKKSQNDSLAKYAMLKYARTLVRPGKRVMLSACDMYMKRSDDAGQNSEKPCFNLDYWANGAGPVTYLSEVYEGVPNETDARFAPIIDTYNEGFEAEECSEADCKECELNQLCHYTEPPIRINKTPVQKTLRDLLLTPAQEEAIEYESGIVRINAGAGVGKTVVVALRTVTLLTKGVKPEEIVLMTFTNAGAEEMRSRIQLYNDDIGTGEDISAMEICTFNSFGDDILKKEYEKFGFTEPPTVIDTVERARIISDILKDNIVKGLDYAHFTTNTKYVKGAVPMAIRVFDIVKKGPYTVLDADTVYNELGMDRRFIKNPHNKPIETITELIKLYDVYDAQLRDNNLIEFADQEMMLFELLQQDPYYLEKFGFKHIIVDEFQDTNLKQMELLKVLVASPSFESLMVVGDDSQAIFSFRNTSPEYIINFRKYIGEENDDIYLLENHRCTPEIIDFANQMNEKNHYRVAKNLIATRPSGKPVVVKGFHTFEDEQKYILDGVKQHIDAGTKPEDIAIICATKNELRRFANMLTKEGIESVSLNPEPLLENSRVQAAIAFVVALSNESDTKNLLIYTNAKLGGTVMSMTEEQINDAIHESQEEVKMINSIDESAKKDKLLEILKAIDLNDDEIYQQFLETLSRKTFEKAVEYCKDFLVFGDGNEARREHDYPGVVLTTAHSSKGLEWPIVYASLSKFDDEKNNLHAKTASGLTALEERRRLLFVTATRARDELYVTSRYIAYGKKGDYTYNTFLSDSYDCIGEPFNIPVIEAEAAEIAREKAAMRKKAREKLAAEMAALKEK